MTNDYKEIVIVGAGGFGREVAWLIEDINKVKKEWSLVGFVDDQCSDEFIDKNGYRILGDIDWLLNQKFYVVIAIGDPEIKKAIFNKLNGSKNIFATLVHPSVILSDSVSMGEGTIICAGNIATVNINIGKHVIVNLDCTIGHDAIIGDFTTIFPGVNISGMVRVGDRVSLGTGSSIIQGITIADGVIVGASATVVKDLLDSGTYVGMPAKKIK